MAFAKDTKPLGAKATYVSNSLSNFKNGFSKKLFDQLDLILNSHILKQTQLHYEDNLDHVFS